MLETGAHRTIRGRSQPCTTTPLPLKKVKRETESISNGYIRVSPAVVRFAGFKIGIEIHRKFTVFAESIQPLRMTLSGDLPPEFFMDMSKKGKIAAGLSQEVSILFTPKSAETHRFTVNVSTELGSLTIPVEAYQVMNPDIPKEFPPALDLGTACLGKTKSIFRKISNYSERSFDFEFNVATFPSEFRVLPSKGVVEPGHTATVELRFEPVEAKQVSVKVQVR